MKEAVYKNSFDLIESFIKKADLLKMTGVKVVSKNGVSEEFKTASRKHDYVKMYKTAITNFDYDFLLKDDSFFQFSFSNLETPEIRYAFFQNPIEYKTLDDFLSTLQDKGLYLEETVDSIGDLFQEEYEQFLTEQQLNSSSITIRYDVDIPNYKPLIHSVSHLHIGHSNSIRIPFDKYITPLKFVLFVIKQVYYYQWEELIKQDNKAILNALNTEKKNCIKLEKHLWTNKEMDELYLT